MPTVPVSVWEQIPVIVLFAFLLAGMAWWMVKAFSKAVADINAHYASIIDASNQQWQRYFDARSDANRLVNQQVVEKLESLTGVIEKLDNDFDKHDAMERQALADYIPARIAPSRRRKNPNG
jgi:hypothetical protein